MKNFIFKGREVVSYVSDKFLQGVSSHWFLYFIFAWFLAQTSYLAITARFRLIPDAGTHIAKIKLFARDGLDPFIQNQEGFYFVGEMIRRGDTLYHYLMSLVYRGSFFVGDGNTTPELAGENTETILLLRFTNIFFVLAGLVLFYLLMKRLGLSAVVRNISLFMMANTMMFIFVASSINYDNMLFLMSMAVFYFLVVFMQTRSLYGLLMLLGSLAIAGLVKKSFLPIGLVVLLLVVYYTCVYRHSIKEQVLNVLNSSWRKKVAYSALLVFVLLFSGLFIERYGVNIVSYGTLNPGCLQVHTYEQCSESPLFTRGQRFRNTPTTYELQPPEFTYKWSNRMRESVFGVLSHKTFSETKIMTYGSYLFIGLMIFAAIRKFNLKEREINTLLFISIYFVIVLLGVNYFGAYMTSGQFGIALQGRYVFPVLPVLFALGNYYVFKLFAQKWLKALYSLFILIIFIPSGILNYIFSTGKEWHTDTVPAIQYEIKQILQWFNKNVLGVFR